MQYRCVCGNVAYINFNNFKSGSRCYACGRAAKIAHDKYTQEEVAAIFGSKDMRLIGTYVNCKTPVEFQCSCGNISKISLRSILMGGHCGCKQRTRNQDGSNNHMWNPNREEVKLRKTLRERYYRMLRTTLKYLDNDKNSKTRELLGYSKDELRTHLINHPNWEMIKDKDWTIDHIFPIIAFIKIGITDPKIVNSLDNLRPILAQENFIKNDRYDFEEFKKYLFIKILRRRYN